MKASELTRSLPQYQELYEIDSKDEFLHCFAYEIAIRDIKSYLINEFSDLQIVNNEIGLTEKGIEKTLKLLEISNEYDELKNDIASNNLTGLSKLIFFKIAVIEDDIRFKYGLNLIDLHIDYSFFSDEFKKIFYALFANSKTLLLDKELYSGIMKSEAYFSKDFIRTALYFPKKQNDTFRDIRTHYTYRYKRPLFQNTILSNNKKADITINTDLPRDLILEQVEKLIDIMKKDSKNIYSNKDKVLEANSIKYECYANNVYEEKRMLVDALLIFDYIEARKKEIISENEKIEKIKIQKTTYIKQSLNLLKDEKREKIREINSSYKKITFKKVKEEIAEKLSMSYDTIDKYHKVIINLLKDENYLKLLEGKDIKNFNV